MTKLSINETKDVLNLIEVISSLVVKEVKGDGLQWTDALTLISNNDFQVKLAGAVAGIKAVGPELADLDGYESLDLAEHVLGLVRKIMDDLTS